MAQALAQVSIVVPVYNVAPYVDQCLSSIAAQTLADIEVIVVDDGSTDGSGAICDEWAARDSRFTVVHQPNRGLSAARNAGLDRATAEYIQFVDSDDYVSPRYTEELLKAARKTGCPCAICGNAAQQAGGWRTATPTSHPTVMSAHDCLQLAMSNKRKQAHRIGFPVWDRIYHRSLFDEHSIRFPEGHVYEDIWIVVPLFRASISIALIPDILYFKRQRKGSITQSRTAQNAIDYVCAREALCAHVASYYQDLLPHANQACERTRIVSSYHLAHLSQEQRSATPHPPADALLREANSHARDLRLPQDARHLAALALLNLSPRAAKMAYRARHKLRRTPT